MNQSRSLTWIGDPTDRRVIQIRQHFLRGLEEQSKTMINYYDFLLVAKKLNFRFEESAHLMELRKYFFANKNTLNNKKLSSMLCIDEDTLKQVRVDCLPDKMIIKFSVEGRIESIKEETNEDQEVIESEAEEKGASPYGKVAKSQVHVETEEKPLGQEYQEKLTIILSIKVTEMIKKIKLLLQGIPIPDEEQNLNLISIFKTISLQKLPYELFRKGVLTLLKKMQNQFVRAKLTMSEDDIRAVFAILDEENAGEVDKNQVVNLFDETSTARKITRFYQARVNRKMVKNTLFKLGKNSNSIQIYQVKNASVLEFKTIQDGLLQKNRSNQKIGKSRIPHFGPIKGAGLRQSPSKVLLSREQERRERHNHSSLTTYKRVEGNLDRERQKIEQIIRSSKQQKKRTGNDTIANKLRKLFIHKVILPRQKLIEEEKLKYVQNRVGSTQMAVKFM